MAFVIYIPPANSHRSIVRCALRHLPIFSALRTDPYEPTHHGLERI